MLTQSDGVNDLLVPAPRKCFSGLLNHVSGKSEWCGAVTVGWREPRKIRIFGIMSR